MTSPAPITPSGPPAPAAAAHPAAAVGNAFSGLLAELVRALPVPGNPAPALPAVLPAVGVSALPAVATHIAPEQKEPVIDGPEAAPKPGAKHDGRTKAAGPGKPAHGMAKVDIPTASPETLGPATVALGLPQASAAQGIIQGVIQGALHDGAGAAAAGQGPDGFPAVPTAALAAAQPAVTDASPVIGAGLARLPAEAPLAEAQGGPDGGNALQSATAPAPAVALASPPPRPAAAEPVAGAAATNGSVARQLSPAFIALAHGPSGATVTLRLDPAGLGHVQVRIERDATGSATVQVTAERPETLRLLVADQPQLHRALDSAGVPPEGRTLGFSLDAPPSSTPPPAGNSMSGGFGGDGARGNSGGQRQGRPGTRYGGSADDPAFITSPAWQRAGVDITA